MIRKEAKNKMKQNRGITIPLKRQSWKLLIEALNYFIEKPYFDVLDGRREEISKLLSYIEKKLGY